MRTHKAVAKSVINEGDRVVIYANDQDYRIIASSQTVVAPGDVIEYEPGGVNFGWLVSINGGRDD